MYVLFKYLSIITFILFFSTINNAYSQRNLKYENVYKDAFSTTDKEFAYMLFTDFYKQNPQSKRANLYYQIAILSYDMTEKYDPLLEFDVYIHYSNLADTMFKLCLEYLNESEVKRDYELFQNVPTVSKKRTIEEIQMFITGKIEENAIKNHYIKKVNDVYKELNENYSICQELYKKFCDKFKNIKDAYLLFDNTINEDIENISSSYDSVLYYLNQYSTLINDKQIEIFEPLTINKQEIQIFRIDGLNTTNFRFSHIQIWDYKTWANEFLKNLETFVSIYQEVIDAVNNLNNRIQFFSTNRTLSDNYIGYEVDNTIIDSLNIFGYYPALNRLIAYKQEKLTLLTISRRKINSADYDDNGKLTIKDKLYYYNKLQKQYNKLELMRKDLEGYALAGNNIDLVAMNFKDFNEFSEYIKDEKFENELEINIAFENLQRYYIREENKIRHTHYVSYKRQSIPMFLESGFYRSSQPQSYITKSIEAAENGIYMAGSIISPEGFATAYIALCSLDSTEIKWLKTIDIGRVMYDNCITAVCPTFDGGCFALIIAKNVTDPELMYSTVVCYNSKGVEVKRITLPEKTLGIGRYIAYDEINEQLTMAFYGNDEFWFEDSTKLVIQKIDLNNAILMNAELKLNGELLDIVSLKNNGILVIGNYFSVIDEKGKEYKLKSEGTTLQSTIFSALFSQDGKLQKIQHYPTKHSSYGIKTVKTSNNNISIIGQKGWARQDPAVPFTADGLVYLLIDDKGDVLYSYQKGDN